MRVIICLMCVLITGAILSAGCSQQQQSLPVTQPTTQLTSQPIQSSGPDLSSGLLEDYSVPPEDIAVSAQINDKDITDKSILVIFSGGKGQKLVKSSWVVIQRADGSIERVEIPPKVRSEVLLQGSGGEDLIRVFAEYFNGNIYKIAEKKVRMRQRV